jgi:hypothetical protein
MNKPNAKNNSTSIRGIFGGGGSGNDGANDTYDGILPNLNLSRKECMSHVLSNQYRT